MVNLTTFMVAATALLLGVKALDLDTAVKIREELKRANIIPEAVEDFEPLTKLRIQYNEEKELKNGDYLSPEETFVVPNVWFDAPSSDAEYTLAMVNLDSNGPLVRHWIATNVKGGKKLESDIMSQDPEHEYTSYKGPTTSATGKAHRIAFVLFEQEDTSQVFVPEVNPNSVKNRDLFDLKQFAEDNGLKPVSAAYFYTDRQNEASQNYLPVSEEESSEYKEQALLGDLVGDLTDNLGNVLEDVGNDLGEIGQDLGEALGLPVDDDDDDSTKSESSSQEEPSPSKSMKPRLRYPPNARPTADSMPSQEAAELQADQQSADLRSQRLARLLVNLADKTPSRSSSSATSSPTESSLAPIHRNKGGLLDDILNLVADVLLDIGIGFDLDDLNGEDKGDKEDDDKEDEADNKLDEIKGISDSLADRLQPKQAGFLDDLLDGLDDLFDLDIDFGHHHHHDGHGIIIELENGHPIVSEAASENSPVESFAYDEAIHNLNELLNSFSAEVAKSISAQPAMASLGQNQ